MSVLLILILFLGICGVCGAVGYVLGYSSGRRAASRERQAGFPVLPADDSSDRSSP